jgi:hypothetical protein
VLVSSSGLVGDTCVFPCDSTGQMIGFELILCAMTVHHRVVLRLAGWDLEATGRCDGPCCTALTEVAVDA